MEWFWIFCAAVAVSALMSRLGTGQRARERPPDDAWMDETPIPPDHPLVPDEIRDAVMPYCNAGCTLHRTQTRTGIEWWLIDTDGELVDAFWLEEQQLR
jgi:hypothetical protein